VYINLELVGASGDVANSGSWHYKNRSKREVWEEDLPSRDQKVVEVEVEVTASLPLVNAADSDQIMGEASAN
jgi:hypothetical protein